MRRRRRRSLEEMQVGQEKKSEMGEKVASTSKKIKTSDQVASFGGFCL